MNDEKFRDARFPPIRKGRDTRPAVYLNKQKCRFIATPVYSDEFHWFEAEYGTVALPDEPFGDHLAWQLIPYTLRDLGPLAKEEAENYLKNKKG